MWLSTCPGAIRVDDRRARSPVPRDPIALLSHYNHGPANLSGFHPAFLASARHEAPLEIANSKFTIRFLLDTSSLEVFAQDGRTALTDQMFPTGNKRSTSLSSEGGKAFSMPKVQQISIHPLKSAVAHPRA
jgi:Glycosyl hydrolases family 32 C terminal